MIKRLSDEKKYSLAAIRDRLAVENYRRGDDEALEGFPRETLGFYIALDLADASPEDLEKTLTNVVLNEFKVRLERLGLERCNETFFDTVTVRVPGRAGPVGDPLVSWPTK